MLSVSVIVVTFNSAVQIGECIRTFRSSQRISEIIVVDNASTDSSVAEALRAGATRIVKNPQNLGFAQAVNQGVSLAVGNLILLLNPDCRASGRMIEAMADQFEENPGLGVLAPGLHNPGRSALAWSAGYFPNLSASAIHAFGLSRAPGVAKLCRGFQLYPAGESRIKSTSVDWVSGACLMTPKSIWRKTDGLSERWFMYAEDIEYCARVKGLGFDVVHDSNLIATHDIGKSSNNRDPEISSLWLINMEDLYLRIVGPSKAVAWLWKTTWATAMLGRSFAFVCISLVRPSRRLSYKEEARKFLTYGRSIAASKAFREDTPGSPHG